MRKSQLSVIPGKGIKTPAAGLGLMACSDGLCAASSLRLIESFQKHRHSDNRAAAMHYP
jgi:hypothetical protein